MEKVKVLFRKNDGEVYAFFPEATANYGMIMSYAHIGQHGEASLQFYWNSEKATKEEYADLLSELEGIYDDCSLVVKQRMNYNDLRASWYRR